MNSLSDRSNPSSCAPNGQAFENSWNGFAPNVTGLACRRQTGALSGCVGRPIGAVTRAMKALAAPVPTNKRARYIARNRGGLPCCPDRAPPLLWQLAGTRKLRRLMHSYQYWRPPDARPYAAWSPPGRQVAATVGLTVLAAAGMAMWAFSLTSGLSGTVTNSWSGTS